MDLNEIRGEIDVVDKEIVGLFEKRMELASQVAEYKRSVGKPILDKERENQKIEALKAIASNEFNQIGIKELFTQIMSISRLYQYQLLANEDFTLEKSFQCLDKLPVDQNTKVCFQGVPGAYSEQALVQFFGEDVKRFHVTEFKDIMRAVQEGEADYGVLPIENSSAGTVGGIYELLMEYDNLTIVGQEIVKVEHALLGMEGTDLTTIERVYSHPQGLLQCSKFLNQYSWDQIEVPNTAMAAEKIQRDQDVKKAAIASERAAKLYNLQVIQSGINHNPNNATRFIILANQNIYQKDAGKISISFTLPHESGSLYKILAHFIFNNVNMNHIESRPLQNKQWEYRFFIDIDGNLNDSAVRNALHGIRKETTEFRIIGNY